MSNLHTEYVELPDIKIAFYQYGKGKNIILLHGNSGSKKMFKKYQKDYFKNFHTIAIDSRGHGESISNDKEYSIKQYSIDVINFCKKLNIREAYVIGVSDGGNIALFLAKDAPDIFKKVIAISPNYLVDGTKEKPLKLIKSLNNIFQILGKIGFSTKKMLMRFKLMLTDIGLSDNDLSSIKTELKIIYAENDMFKEDHIKTIGSLIPNAIIKRIEKCNHLTIFNKRQTIEEINSFLNN